MIPWEETAAASDAGYPNTPVEIAGNAMEVREWLAASRSEF
jgi:hypothetical protein